MDLVNFFMHLAGGMKTDCVPFVHLFLRISHDFTDKTSGVARGTIEWSLL